MSIVVFLVTFTIFLRLLLRDFAKYCELYDAERALQISRREPMIEFSVILRRYRRPRNQDSVNWKVEGF